MKSDETLQAKLRAFSAGNGEEQYDNIRNIVEKKYLNHNGYRTVALSKLFEGLFPTTLSVNNAPGQAWSSRMKNMNIIYIVLNVLFLVFYFSTFYTLFTVYG